VQRELQRDDDSCGFAAAANVDPLELIGITRRGRTRSEQAAQVTPAGSR
jgi:hypothetical protein